MTRAKWAGFCRLGGHRFPVGTELGRDGRGGWACGPCLAGKSWPDRVRRYRGSAFSDADIAALRENARGLSDYGAAKARLSAADRADWTEVEIGNEFFDGEDEIALAALNRWLDERRVEAENDRWERAAARRERERDRAEYAAGVEDANRWRFNRDMFGEAYAAAEEYARDLRGLNGDW